MPNWPEIAAAAAGVATTAGLLAGGAAYAARWPTSQIFGHTLIDAPDDAEAGQHTVALTYDDGPSPRNTPALLDLLAKHGVHATFFLIGNHVRKHAALARAVAAAGHVVGNHTEMHPDLARKDDQRVRQELERTQDILQDTLGLTPTLFRPPYGSRRPGVLRIARSMNLVPVMWNVMPRDWEPLGTERLLRNIDAGMAKNRARQRTSNILLHDASHLDGTDPASRADTLSATAALLQRADLRFTTVDHWL